MNIEEKFEKGSKSHTYQRIDSEFQVNVFLGYNNDGQMSMAIIEPGRESLVKSSKLIDVSFSKRSDHKIELYFNLLDESYKPMFLVFCKDIIVVCERAGSQMAISNALTRWKYWKEMFGKKKNILLEKQEIKGLIGELKELKDHFLNRYDEETAIKSWMGPLLGHKDFEIDDTWYEIKAVSENAVQVNISSLEQLESENDGHLVIIRLEDVSPTSKNAINLNQMVLRVTDMIKDPDVLELFRVRLDNMGYVPDEEYNNVCFEFKGRQSYQVTSSFPRLTRNSISDAIGNAKYTIMFNGISDFKEMES